MVCGSNTGLVGLLKKNGIEVPVLHCIIHQEALCGKFMKFNEIMRHVVKIINLIRGGNRAQSHSKLISFLEEMSAEYKDISLYSEIRWLSAGKTLIQFAT
jgi:hypothetical protein